MQPRIICGPIEGFQAGIIAGALALCLAVPFTSAAQTPAADNPVVATVDGTEIRLDEILALRASMPDSYAKLPLSALLEPLIEQAVNSRLVLAKAEADGLGDDPDVAARLSEIAARLMQEVWLTRQIESHVTEGALRDRYAAFIKENPPQSEIKASHILLKTEAEARQMLKRLSGGANFGELAREYSTGPSASQDGDLGFFARGQMVPAFEAAAFGLETGKHTLAPVQTQFGWHIIQVTDRRSAEPPPYEEVRSELAAEMSEQAIGTIVAALRSTAKVEIKPLDPALLQATQRR